MQYMHWRPTLQYPEHLKSILVFRAINSLILWKHITYHNGSRGMCDYFDHAPFRAKFGWPHVGMLAFVHFPTNKNAQKRRHSWNLKWQFCYRVEHKPETKEMDIIDPTLACRKTDFQQISRSWKCERTKLKQTARCLGMTLLWAIPGCPDAPPKSFHMSFRHVVLFLFFFNFYFFLLFCSFLE